MSPAMNTRPRFSVILCSIEPLKFARISAGYTRLLAAYPHEIIGIHDAASLAEGYNRGMAQSTGDILIFSHDDILILDPGFADKLAQRLEHLDLLGFAGTDKLITATWFGAGQPHLHGVIAHAKPGDRHLSLNVYGVHDWPVAGNIQAIDGFCMVATRSTALAVGFDAATFDGFHLYDLDFSYSAYLAGYRLGACCDIPILYESSGNFGFSHLHYAERFVLKHVAELGHTDPKAIQGGFPGRVALFPDHQALLQAWQPALLQRATLAMNRPDSL